MGRPELARALHQVAAQSYRPLEIVLVDASGEQAAIQNHQGIPVRFVSKGRLDRARAANAAIAAARGAAMLFFDEDDEIEPDHIADLQRTLAATPDARVAYSQTRLVDAAGATQRVFGGPFDRLALFRSNYLAIHAVLFRRSLVTEGCRFDESLPVFEDWDFWLQLAMRTPFAFTGKPTAIYHATSGESGAGAGTNLDRATVLAHREQLMRKWENARKAIAIASGQA